MATIPTHQPSRQRFLLFLAICMDLGRSLLAARRSWCPSTLQAAPLELTLRPDRPQRLDGIGGRTIRCTSGCVWITVPGIANDIFLRNGESWQMPCGGRVLAEAVHHAEIAVTD